MKHKVHLELNNGDPFLVDLIEERESILFYIVLNLDWNDFL